MDPNDLAGRSPLGGAFDMDPDERRRQFANPGPPMSFEDELANALGNMDGGGLLSPEIPPMPKAENPSSAQEPVKTYERQICDIIPPPEKGVLDPNAEAYIKDMFSPPPNMPAMEEEMDTPEPKEQEGPPLSVTEQIELSQYIFKKTWTKSYKLGEHIVAMKPLQDLEVYEIQECVTMEDKKYKRELLTRIYVLAKSIIKLDNYDVQNEILKLNFLKKCNVNIINYLYKCYVRTVDCRNNLITKIPRFAKTPVSKMKFTVVKEARGVISESRFTKLTDEQWYWHYFHILLDKKEQSEQDYEKMNYLSYFINPKMAQKIHEDKKSDANWKTRKQNMDSQFYNDIWKFIDRLPEKDKGLALKNFNNYVNNHQEVRQQAQDVANPPPDVPIKSNEGMTEFDEAGMERELDQIGVI